MYPNVIDPPIDANHKGFSTGPVSFNMSTVCEEL